MNLRFARSLVALLVLAVFGVWAWILSIAADPGTRMGRGLVRTGPDAFRRYFPGLFGLLRPLATGGMAAAAGPRGLSVAAIVLAAALVELPALVGLVDYRRVLVPRCMGGSGPHNRQLDPELVYRHLPHDHFVHQQVGDSTAGLAIPGARRYRAECRCDANGFRNAKDLRQADVVLLGDSFVEGYNVTQEAILAKTSGRSAVGRGLQPGPLRIRPAAGTGRVETLRCAAATAGGRLVLLRRQ